MSKIQYRCFERAEVRASEDGSRKMTFVASDSTRDSAGTVLNMDGWDLVRFNSNGVIGYQHKVYGAWDDTANPDNIIGKGFAYLEGEGAEKKLMVDVEFEPEGMNDLADKIYKKLQFGTLKAVSVGFGEVGKGHWGEGEEKRNGENPTYYFAGQQLYEVSVVNIPANPNALKRYVDDAEPEVAEDPIVETPQEETPVEDNSAEVIETEKQKSLSIARATLLNC